MKNIKSFYTNRGIHLNFRNYNRSLINKNFLRVEFKMENINLLDNCFFLPCYKNIIFFEFRTTS